MDQQDAWVCAVCIGIILVCLVLIGIHLIRFFAQENEFNRQINRREKIERMRRRSKR